MKRTFIYLFILIIGGGIGYLISNYIGNKNSTPTEPIIERVEKVKKKKIRDTVYIEKKVPLLISQDSITSQDQGYTDSLEVIIENENDSSAELLTPTEYEEDTTEYEIIGDELLSQRTVILTPNPIDSTDVSSLLDLKSFSFAERMTIEFWKSPLNITGYELSRNKLKLFGFNPTETISLRLNDTGDQLFLNTETMSIVLRKSKNFQTLNLK